jgi:hypothetical protein
MRCADRVHEKDEGLVRDNFGSEDPGTRARQGARPDEQGNPRSVQGPGHRGQDALLGHRGGAGRPRPPACRARRPGPRRAARRAEARQGRCPRRGRHPVHVRRQGQDQDEGACQGPVARRHRGPRSASVGPRRASRRRGRGACARRQACPGLPRRRARPAGHRGLEPPSGHAAGRAAAAHRRSAGPAAAPRPAGHVLGQRAPAPASPPGRAGRGPTRRVGRAVRPAGPAPPRPSGRSQPCAAAAPSRSSTRRPPRAPARRWRPPAGRTAGRQCAPRRRFGIRRAHVVVGQAHPAPARPADLELRQAHPAPAGHGRAGSRALTRRPPRRWPARPRASLQSPRWWRRPSRRRRLRRPQWRWRRWPSRRCLRWPRWRWPRRRSRWWSPRWRPPWWAAPAAASWPSASQP